MNIKLLLENYKNKLLGSKKNNNPALIKTENLYLCEIRRLDSYKPISIIIFSYEFSSGDLIIARKIKDNIYEDVFYLNKYKTEDNITPTVGEFFVTKKARLDNNKKFESNDNLKTYLKKVKYQLIKSYLDNNKYVLKQYDCGNDEVCADCSACGKLEYETSLLDIQNLPVCVSCFEGFQKKCFDDSKQYQKKRN